MARKSGDQALPDPKELKQNVSQKKKNKIKLVSLLWDQLWNKGNSILELLNTGN